MGDRPVETKGGKTPLEAAATPNLDRLASAGVCGIMDPISPGIRAGSDTAHLAILGYNPYEYYTGRGPFEALGIGMDVRGGDVALRCNFSTVDQDMRVVDRRAGRIREGTKELAAALNGLVIDGVTCLVKESIEHRAALLLRGEGLDGKVTDVDPHVEKARVHDCAPTDPEDRAAARTAAVINEFVAQSHRILKEHPVNKDRENKGLPPANTLLPRGAGLAPHLGRFVNRYGFTGACVVEVGLVKGIGRYLNMEVVDVPGSTGGVDTDMPAVIGAAIDAAGRHPFVLCNIKAPDLAGHDGDFDQKVGLIQRIDDAIAPLLSPEMVDTLVIVTADHATPVAVKDHSGDAVPVLMCGAGVAVDVVASFGERAAAQGGLGRVRGYDIMPMITNLIGRQEKFGA
jgi:2,3-bisphosphoglycerate-independent phosphoglycerate mutase